MTPLRMETVETFFCARNVYMKTHAFAVGLYISLSVKSTTKTKYAWRTSIILLYNLYSLKFFVLIYHKIVPIMKCLNLQ